MPAITNRLEIRNTINPYAELIQQIEKLDFSRIPNQTISKTFLQQELKMTVLDYMLMDARNSSN